MKERISIAVVLLVVVVVYFCLIVHARGQGFTPRRPFILQSAAAGSTNTGPYLIPGIYVWWHYEDALSQGTNATMTNWIDRIQGRIFTNETSAQRPVAKTNGVYFDNTTFLSNVVAVDLTTDYSLIFTVLEWTNNGNVYSTYLSYEVNHLAAGSRAYSINQAPNWIERVGAGAYYGLTSDGNIHSNVLFTLASMNVKTNDMFFTNGITCRVGATGGAQKFSNVGGVDAEWGFKGLVRDIIVYTNIFIDPTLITNLQYWAYTNYGVPYYP